MNKIPRDVSSTQSEYGEMSRQADSLIQNKQPSRNVDHDSTPAVKIKSNESKDNLENGDKSTGEIAQNNTKIRASPNGEKLSFFKRIMTTASGRNATAKLPPSNEQLSQGTSLIGQHNSSPSAKADNNQGKAILSPKTTMHDPGIAETSVQSIKPNQLHARDLDASAEINKLRKADPLEAQQALSNISDHMPHMKPGEQVKILSYLADSLGYPNIDLATQQKIVKLIEVNFPKQSTDDFQTKFYVGQVVQNLAKVLSNGRLQGQVDAPVSEFLMRNRYGFGMEIEEQNNIEFNLRYARDNANLSPSAKEILKRLPMYPNNS